MQAGGCNCSSTSACRAWTSQMAYQRAWLAAICLGLSCEPESAPGSPVASASDTTVRWAAQLQCAAPRTRRMKNGTSCAVQCAQSLHGCSGSRGNTILPHNKATLCSLCFLACILQRQLHHSGFILSKIAQIRQSNEADKKPHGTLRWLRAGSCGLFLLQVQQKHVPQLRCYVSMRECALRQRR